LHFSGAVGFRLTKRWGYPSMNRLTLLLLAQTFVAGSLISSPTTVAQEADNPTATSQETASTAEKDWYYGPTKLQPKTETPGRLRAQLRASQRLARLESMRWYGFSASRPTASGLPFTTMYAPAWTRPGGRPFAWYTSQRPVVVVSPYYPSYYR